MIIESGALFVWFFHYMPVGNDAVTELLPTPEQRETVYRPHPRVPLEKADLHAWISRTTAEYVGGCIAGGRRYLHINAKGDVEPCVFIHYSNVEHPRRARSWTRSEARSSRPITTISPSTTIMLRPCPMLENPEILRRLVAETGAVNTDYMNTESADHLCGKCTHYAECWKPKADELWQAEQAKRADK